MKRSKIFLFLTTGCLATAGLFAAKANHFAKTVGYYRTAGNHCAAIALCVQDNNSMATCIAPNGNKVFTQRQSATSCSVPMHFFDL